jgi:hypothetical protein
MATFNDLCSENQGLAFPRANQRPISHIDIATKPAHAVTKSKFSERQNAFAFKQKEVKLTSGRGDVVI